MITNVCSGVCARCSSLPVVKRAAGRGESDAAGAPLPGISTRLAAGRWQRMVAAPRVMAWFWLTSRWNVDRFISVDGCFPFAGRMIPSFDRPGGLSRSLPIHNSTAVVICLRFPAPLLIAPLQYHNMKRVFTPRIWMPPLRLRHLYRERKTSLACLSQLSIDVAATWNGMRARRKKKKEKEILSPLSFLYIPLPRLRNFRSCSCTLCCVCWRKRHRPAGVLAFVLGL